MGKFSIDKSSGRSRGNGRPYPVPFLPAPKFGDSSIPHAEDLDDEKSIAFLKAIQDESVEIYEKVDGSVAVLFGRDKYGFWSSKKTGKRVRLGESFVGKHVETVNEVHSVLEQFSDIIERIWPTGTFASADVIENLRPNTIEYSCGKTIVIHDLYKESSGRIDRSESLRLMKKIPSQFKDWKISFRRERKDIKLSSLLSENLNFKSDYGSFSEGLVLVKENFVTKIVDKNEFTRLNKEFWKFRDHLGKEVVREFKSNLADILKNRSVLSPNFQKKIVESARITEEIDLDKAVFSHLHAFGEKICLDKQTLRESFSLLVGKTEARVNELFEEWMLKYPWKEKLPVEVVLRTDRSFIEANDWINSLKETMNDPVLEFSIAPVIKLLISEAALEKLSDALDYNKAKEHELRSWIEEKFGTVQERINGTKDSGLDRGYHSDVFLLNTGRVLKLTTDSSDADAAAKIKGKKQPGLATIVSVGRVPDQFKRNKDIFFIVSEERLKPIPDQDAENLDEASYILYNAFVEKPPYGKVPWEEFKKLAFEKANEEGNVDAPNDEKINWAFSIFEKFNIQAIAETLIKNRIYDFWDYNGGNLMMRGNEIVLVDFGQSKITSAPKHHTFEKIEEAKRIYKNLRGSEKHISEWIGARTLLEQEGILRQEGVLQELDGGRAGKIGLTIGRFQPFHKAHADLIRSMAKRYDKVIVCIAGNKPSKDNPFSLETRRELMELSLPDVEPKLETFEVETGYLPDILEKVALSGESSYKAGKAVEVVVGDDRLQSFKQQLDQALATAEAGPDLSAIRVISSPNARESGPSGTDVRKAIASNNRDQVLKSLDPHVSSDPAKFDILYQKLRKELGQFVQISESSFIVLNEFLTDIAATKSAGEKLLKQIVIENISLLSKRGIEMQGAKKLGTGSNGTAWRLSDKRVFKVTTDDAEASSAKRIEGANLDHIYKIYDVFAFPGDYNGHRVYGIVQEENLEEPSDEEIEQFKWTVNTLKSAYDGAEEDLGNGKLKSIISALLKKEEMPLEYKRYLLELIKKFELNQMIADLRKVGIVFMDMHDGNFMKRGDKFVLIDLGTGGDQDSAKPSLIESVIKEDSSADLSSIGGRKTTDELLKMNAQKLQAFGVVSPKYINEGTMGVVYSIGNNRVIKITVDHDEVNANAILIGKSNKHLNNIYHVFAFKEIPESAHGTQLYGIIQDILTETSSEEKKDINRISHYLGHDDIIDTLATKPWAETLNAIRTHEQKQLSDDIAERQAGKKKPTSEEIQYMQETSQEHLMRTIQLMQKYSIPEMVDELRKNGIYFADFHSGNVMKKGSIYVINDLSKSRTQNGSKMGDMTMLEFGGIPGGGFAKSGSSSWSNGMIASIGRDDSADKERLLGWPRGKKNSVSKKKNGQSRLSKKTSTKS